MPERCRVLQKRRQTVCAEKEAPDRRNGGPGPVIFIEVTPKGRKGKTGSHNSLVPGRRPAKKYPKNGNPLFGVTGFAFSGRSWGEKVSRIEEIAFWGHRGSD